MSMFENYKKAIAETTGQVYCQSIILSARHDAEYISNGSRTIIGLMENGILIDYQIKLGHRDTRGMRLMNHTPGS